MRRPSILAAILVSLAVLTAASSASAMYHPTMGKWVARDPSGYRPQDLSAYQYVRSGPILLTDPLGLECVKCSAADKAKYIQSPDHGGLNKASGPDEIMAAHKTTIEQTDDQNRVGYSSRTNTIRLWNQSTKKENYTDEIHEVTSGLLGREFLGTSEGDPISGTAAKSKAFDESPNPDLNRNLVSGTHNLALIMEIAAICKQSPEQCRKFGKPFTRVATAHFAPPGAKEPVPWEEELKALYGFICSCSSGGLPDNEQYGLEGCIKLTSGPKIWDAGFSMRCMNSQVVVERYWLDYYAP